MQDTPPIPSTSNLVAFTLQAVLKCGGTASTRQVAEFYKASFPKADELFVPTFEKRPKISIFRERIANSCREAAKNNLLQRVSHGRYSITTKGREALAREVLGNQHEQDEKINRTNAAVNIVQDIGYRSNELPKTLDLNATLNGRIFDFEYPQASGATLALTNFANAIPSIQPKIHEGIAEPLSRIANLKNFRPLETHSGVAPIAPRLARMDEISSGISFAINRMLERLSPSIEELLPKFNFSKGFEVPPAALTSISKEILQSALNLRIDHKESPADYSPEILDKLHSIGETIALSIHNTSHHIDIEGLLRNEEEKDASGPLSTPADDSEFDEFLQAFRSPTETFIEAQPRRSEEELAAAILETKAFQDWAETFFQRVTSSNSEESIVTQIVAFVVVTIELIRSAYSSISSSLAAPEINTEILLLSLSGDFFIYLGEVFILSQASRLSRRAI